MASKTQATCFYEENREKMSTFHLAVAERTEDSFMFRELIISNRAPRKEKQFLKDHKCPGCST